MIKRSKSVECTMIIVLLLIISVLFNIYFFSKIGIYKYKIEKQSYIEIEDIHQRNESNMDILSKSVEEGSIKNEELLKLYKNYDVIAGDIMGLWQQYNSYTQNELPLFSKNIETNKVIENDIHGKIKEYLLSILNKEMENEQNKLVLENHEFECFKTMNDMSIRIYDYFNKFNIDSLDGSTGEQKEKKIINNHYWIDMLEGIYDINDDYVNVEWKI